MSQLYFLPGLRNQKFRLLALLLMLLAGLPATAQTTRYTLRGQVNDASGTFNMVYRRPDGTIGWVEPQRTA